MSENTITLKASSTNTVEFHVEFDPLAGTPKGFLVFHADGYDIRVPGKYKKETKSIAFTLQPKVCRDVIEQYSLEMLFDSILVTPVKKCSLVWIVDAELGATAKPTEASKQVKDTTPNKPKNASDNKADEGKSKNQADGSNKTTETNKVKESAGVEILTDSKEVEHVESRDDKVKAVLRELNIQVPAVLPRHKRTREALDRPLSRYLKDKL